METRQKVFSGLQPTGNIHIGNYLGALKNWVALQDDYDTVYCVVDLHAITLPYDPAEFKKERIEAAKVLMAVGIDPERSMFYFQSQVPQHAELSWILGTVTPTGVLNRMTQHKEKAEKDGSNLGLYSYPVLMAADILLYDAELVPVGEDQRQHIEYTREAANKFNSAYGNTFTLPQEIILENVGVVPGTDGQKMSKSYNNTIPLFGTREEIQKAVMSIVTDTKGTFPEHVYAIHKLYKSDIELKSLYEQNKGNYKVLKEALTVDSETHVATLREKRQEFASNKAHVLEILAEGADRARKQAAKKMEIVRDRIGLKL